MPLDVDWDEEPVPDLSQFSEYEEAREAFRWRIPDEYNLGRDVTTRHAGGGDDVALFEHGENAPPVEFTFDEIDRMSNRLAARMLDLGVERGDRVAVVSDQRVETAVTHVATYKIGGIVVPLSKLYGPEGVRYRLQDSEPTLVVVEPSVPDDIVTVAERIDPVESTIHLPAADAGKAERMEELGPVEDPGGAVVAATSPTDPAMIIYTSGTTGDPKGVVHSHDYIIGALPGYQQLYELPWHAELDPVIYTPASWAWAGGIINCLFPAWHYGVPVVADRSKSAFDPGRVMDLIDEYGVTNSFFAPTMIKMMYDELDRDDRAGRSMEVVFVGGEPLNEEIHSRARAIFGDISVNGQYGSTEGNIFTADCRYWFDQKLGSMGKPVPGRPGEIVDDEGESLPVDEDGNVAYRQAPGVAVGYWDDGEVSELPTTNGWFLSGDVGFKDGDGYFWFVSRKDDVIITSGYRVSPREIENTLLGHDRVAEAVVVGVDHEVRGQIPKAYIVLADGETDADGSVAETLQTHVKDELAKYQYPREIEIVEDVPKTATGKVKRQELE